MFIVRIACCRLWFSCNNCSSTTINTNVTRGPTISKYSDHGLVVCTMLRKMRVEYTNAAQPIVIGAAQNGSADMTMLTMRKLAEAQKGASINYKLQMASQRRQTSKLDAHTSKLKGAPHRRNGNSHMHTLVKSKARRLYVAWTQGAQPAEPAQRCGTDLTLQSQHHGSR